MIRPHDVPKRGQEHPRTRRAQHLQTLHAGANDAEHFRVSEDLATVKEPFQRVSCPLGGVVTMGTAELLKDGMRHCLVGVWRRQVVGDQGELEPEILDDATPKLAGQLPLGRPVLANLLRNDIMDALTTAVDSTCNRCLAVEPLEAIVNSSGHRVVRVSPGQLAFEIARFQRINQ